MDEESFINKEFLQKALHNYLRNGVKVIEYESKAAVPTGDNFTSDLYRVLVKYTLENGKQTESVSVIVKCRPEDGSTKQDLTTDLNMFEKEEEMFEKVLPKLYKLLGEEMISARCYYTESKPHYIIVLEDLRVYGFRMVDRHAGFDLDHCLLVLEHLAKMHAASAVLHEKEPHCYKNFYKGLFSDATEKFLKSGFKSLIAATYRWPGFEKYGDFMAALGDNCFERSVAAGAVNANGFNVLNHGDLWINNMIFKYNNDGKVEDVRFLDFQTIKYSSPALDLHNFFCTSPSFETHRLHYDTMVKHYHDNLVQMLAKLNYPPNKIPTLEELSLDLKKRGFYALCATAAILPIVKMGGGDDATFDELMRCNVNEGVRLDMYTNERYTPYAQHLLTFFDKNGFLD